MAVSNGFPVTMVSEPFEPSEDSTMVSEVRLQQAVVDLSKRVETLADEQSEIRNRLRRMEERLVSFMATKSPQSIPVRSQAFDGISTQAPSEPSDLHRPISGAHQVFEVMPKSMNSKGIEIKDDLPKETDESIQLKELLEGVCLMVGSYGLLGESPKSRGDGPILAKDLVNSGAHLVLDEISAPIRRKEIEVHSIQVMVEVNDKSSEELDSDVAQVNVDVKREVSTIWNDLIVVKDETLDLSNSQLVFDPGIPYKGAWSLGGVLLNLEYDRELQLFRKDLVDVPNLWQACLFCVNVNQHALSASKFDQAGANFLREKLVTHKVLADDVTGLNVVLSLVRLIERESSENIGVATIFYMGEALYMFQAYGSSTNPNQPDVHAPMVEVSHPLEQSILHTLVVDDIKQYGITFALKNWTEYPSCERIHVHVKHALRITKVSRDMMNTYFEKFAFDPGGDTVTVIIIAAKSVKCHLLFVLIYELMEKLMGLVKCLNSCCEVVIFVHRDTWIMVDDQEEIYYSGHHRLLKHQLAPLKLLSDRNKAPTSTDTGSAEPRQLGSTFEELTLDASFLSRYHPLFEVAGLLVSSRDRARCIESLKFELEVKRSSIRSIKSKLQLPCSVQMNQMLRSTTVFLLILEDKDPSRREYCDRVAKQEKLQLPLVLICDGKEQCIELQRVDRELSNIRIMYVA